MAEAGDRFQAMRTVRTYPVGGCDLSAGGNELVTVRRSGQGRIVTRTYHPPRRRESYCRTRSGTGIIGWLCSPAFRLLTPALRT